MTKTKAKKPNSKKLMIRGLPQTGYAALSTRFIQDGSLTGEARIVGAYLLSKSSNWEVDVEHLRLHFRWSSERIYRYLGELVVHGYCIRRRLQGAGGTFDGSEYVISDDKNAIRAIYFEWQREGFSFYPSDEKRWAKSEPEAPKEDVQSEPSSAFPHTVKPYTENPNAELYRDTTKAPLSPPSRMASGASDRAGDAQASGEASTSQTPEPPGEGREGIRPPGGALRSPTGDPPRGTAEGSAGKGDGQGEALAPVTVHAVIRAYELINKRNLRKAEERLRDLTPVELAALWQSLDQLTAYHARTNTRPPELWEYAGTRGFRQFPPKKLSADPDAVLARERPPEPDTVLAGPLGLRAAEGRWVLELVDFIQAQRRIPDEIECARLEREGRAKHQQLVLDEREIAAGRLTGPGVAVFLGKRRMLIAKALRMHGRAPPGDSTSDPPVRHQPARPAAAGGSDAGEEFAAAHYARR